MRRMNPGRLELCAIVLFILPTVTSCKQYSVADEEYQRRACASNLRQLAHALQAYRQDYGRFPPATFSDEATGNVHSWRLALLPYMEHAPLFEAYRTDEPWNSPANQHLTELGEIVDLRCPSNHSGPLHQTNYVMVVREPPDDSSNDSETDSSPAILIVEVANSGIHWAEPRDLVFDEMSFKINDPDKLSLSSHHPDGVHVLRSDGTVEFLSVGLSPDEVRALLEETVPRKVE